MEARSQLRHRPTLARRQTPGKQASSSIFYYPHGLVKRPHRVRAGDIQRRRSNFLTGEYNDRWMETIGRGDWI
jgi:hypothetical protein